MKTIKFIVYNLPDNLRLMHPQPKADKCYKDELIATQPGCYEEISWYQNKNAGKFTGTYKTIE